MTSINEIRVSIDGLKIGMYVSRLDQPWLETPFPLQGLSIQSPRDIEELKGCCDYVYVDVDRGPVPNRKYFSPLETSTYIKEVQGTGHHRDSTSLPDRSSSNELNQLRKTTYEDKTLFTDEVKAANEAYSRVAKEIEGIITHLEQGKELDLKLVKDGISEMVESIINNPSAMMWMVQMKKVDNYTYTRSLSTSVWCASFGRFMGMEKQVIETLALGGLLLDLGKSSLPSELLKSKDKLSSEEKEKMTSHVDLGVQLLVEKSREISDEKVRIDLLQMIATHHERADGSGYPQGLKNAEIPLFGKIGGIADSFDAMTSERPYVTTGAMSPHEAISELYSLRDSKFQPDLIEQFIQVIGIYPIGSLVELNTGEVGAVISISKERRLRPSVMLFLDEDKNPVSPLRQIDLSKIDGNVSIAKGLPVGAYGIEMEDVFIAY